MCVCIKIVKELPKTKSDYDYIQTNEPVKTADILAQKITGRSHTFARLKDLEREDKIYKVAHGIYNTV